MTVGQAEQETLGLGLDLFIQIIYKKLGCKCVHQHSLLQIPLHDGAAVPGVEAHGGWRRRAVPLDRFPAVQIALDLQTGRQAGPVVHQVLSSQERIILLINYPSNSVIISAACLTVMFPGTLFTNTTPLPKQSSG